MGRIRQWCGAIGLSLLAGSSFLRPLEAFGQASTRLYSETFSWCLPEEAVGAVSEDTVGWKGLVQGEELGKPSRLKVSKKDSKTKFAPPPPVGNSPIGAAPGSIEWLKFDYDAALPPEGRRPVTLFTDELRAPVSDLGALVFDLRIDPLTYPAPRQVPFGARAAILVDGIWFISDTLFPPVGASEWQSGVVFDIQNSTYGSVAARPKVGPGRPENSGLPLPDAGVVRGIGLMLTLPAKMRVDNFATYSRYPVAEVPAAVPASCAYVPGSDGANAGGPPLPAPEAQWCAVKTRKLHPVKMSRAEARKALAKLRAPRGELTKLSTRVLVQLFRSKSGAPIEALVNARRSEILDLGPQMTLQSFAISGFPGFTVGGRAAADLRRYLQETALLREEHPVFVAMRRGPKGEIPTGRSLCADELLTMVKKAKGERVAPTKPSRGPSSFAKQPSTSKRNPPRRR